jgi:hypothetical protein
MEAASAFREVDESGDEVNSIALSSQHSGPLAFLAKRNRFTVGMDRPGKKR